MPEAGFPARVARAFAYVLLVVTCTVIAALGGYQVGVRSNPSEETSAAERQAAVRNAVHTAVARQKATDRRLRRSALRDLAAFQRDRFESELAKRVSEVRIAEAANAARAYKRGKAAGATVVAEEATTATEGATADEKDDTPG